jgi:hypothetical protein
MNQYEVPAAIVDAFPETSKDILYLSAIGNAYETMTVFAQFMRKNVMEHQFYKVKKCMKLAQHIYNRGNSIVKNAVESAFIYAFSFISQLCNKKEWALVKSTIPQDLYSVYIKQVIGYGS